MILKYTLIIRSLCIGFLTPLCQHSAQKVEMTQIEIFKLRKTESTFVYDKIEMGSSIAWRASHLGGIDPREGEIFCNTAEISVEKDKIINASISIDMNNITVNNLPDDGAKNLVEHLKSDDFFNIVLYPTSSFELTNSEAINGEFDYKFTGKLTMLGISKVLHLRGM